VSGGAVPLENEVYINLLGLDELRWADAQGGILYAGAGVTMERLKNFAAEAGWCFPIIPGSEKWATVGAMLACNGGGPYSLRYGKMDNFVKGMEFTDVNGRNYSWGGQSKKVSEGPAFHKMFIGSEGTLGFISGVYLACVAPLPELQLLRIAHSDFFALLPLLPTLLKMNPLFLEMAEMSALRFSSGVEESVIWVGLEDAIDMAERLPFSLSLLDASALSERFNIGRNLQTYKPFIDLDISFPLGQSMAILSGIKNILEEALCEHIFFGHAGDGNWHIHVFYEEEITENIRTAIAEIDRLLWRHQGHLSGEHGIGRIHQARWQRFASEDWKFAYQMLKQQFDPEGRLPMY
jgi:FAD/FMN-containing dehydrogenase